LAVKIRLTRFGKKKKPFYRIVVADNDFSRDGRIVKQIGYYDPQLEKLEIKEEEALEWLSKGAIPTPTVKSLFKRKGINKKLHEMKYAKKESK